MTAAFLVDGQGPVYGAPLAQPGGLLHRAVLHPRSDDPWAGCSMRGRLDEDTLVFKGEADPARLCRATGCAGVPWNRGLGR